MLKAELHTHINEDPQDTIPYTGQELILRARSLGYDVVAITCHGKYLVDDSLIAFGARNDILVLAGIEASIEGYDVLIYNATPRVESIRTLQDLRSYKVKHPDMLIIAPHPFFPDRACLGEEVFRYADLFDAWEVHGMYTLLIDYNRRTLREAKRRNVPLVGNGDVHRLGQLNHTFTLIDAPKTRSGVVRAIKDGHTRIVRRPAPAHLFLLAMIDGARYKARQLLE